MVQRVAVGILVWANILLLVLQFRLGGTMSWSP